MKTTITSLKYCIIQSNPNLRFYCFYCSSISGWKLSWYFNNSINLERKQRIRFNDAFIFIKRKQMRNTELFDKQKLASSGTYLE